MLMRTVNLSWPASIKPSDMEMNTRNQKDDLWLQVAFEIKKAANGSTAMEMKTVGNDQYVLKTEKVLIRMIKNGSGTEIRSADFTNGDFWHASDNENAKILAEITDGEKAELKRNFGILIKENL